MEVLDAQNQFLQLRASPKKIEFCSIKNNKRRNAHERRTQKFDDATNFMMLSRNIVSRRSTLLARAVRAKSTQVHVDQSSGPIATDGRHEVSYEENYDNEMK